MTDHVLTITPRPWSGSIPFVFDGACSCGRWREPGNAYKWVALGAQSHLIAEGLTNGRGLLKPEGEPEMGA